MEEYLAQNRLISHSFSPEVLPDKIRSITDRINQQGDKPYATVACQLELLSQLNEFDFGRYLLQNQGINGYWTHYMLTHPWLGRQTGLNNGGEIFSELEKFLLNRAPTMLATQQRFQIFLKENQKCIKDKAKLACIPSGMMGELLYLDYTGVEKIELTGIDYDSSTLEDAKALAKQKNLLKFSKFIKQDAWALNFQNEFDLISSNGLNIYEPNENRVSDLYRQFYTALKPNGKLVTSFLTHPPHLSNQCEWDLNKINSSDLLLQKIIFVDIIDAKWQCYQSTEQTYQQLETVGFKNIEFIYDEAKLFPTVVAYK